MQEPNMQPDLQISKNQPAVTWNMQLNISNNTLKWIPSTDPFISESGQLSRALRSVRHLQWFPHPVIPILPFLKILIQLKSRTLALSASSSTAPYTPQTLPKRLLCQQECNLLDEMYMYSAFDHVPRWILWGVFSGWWGVEPANGGCPLAVCLESEFGPHHQE